MTDREEPTARWQRHRRCTLAVGAATLIALACSQPQDRAGTNTNWLRSCGGNDVCGRLECRCGRCTLPCSSDVDCAGGATCANEAATALQCAGPETTTCLAPCVGSDDCTSGQVCYRGSCVDSLPPSECEDDPSALVCEDFERAPTSFAEVVTAGNAIATVASPTPSGSSVLEATVTSAPSVAYLRADLPAQTSGTLYLRGWVRVPSGDAGYDLAPLGLWSNAEQDWALRLVVKDGMLELWSYTTPQTDPVALIPGAWHCLQAAIVVGEAPDGGVEVALDGTVVATVSELDTLPDGGIDAMTVGTQWAGAPATIEVDRVYLGPREVGCFD